MKNMVGSISPSSFQVYYNQMAHLLHMLNTWIGKLIVESKEHFEKRCDAATKYKVQVVYRWFNYFKM